MPKSFLNKTLILITSLLAGSFGSFAHDAVKMTEPDGKETVFILADHPIVTVENNAIIVTTDNQNISLELEPNIIFRFCDADGAGVETAAKSLPTFKIDDTRLEGNNLQPRTLVTIYDISGRMTASATTDDAGFVSIVIADLPAGVYIVGSNSNNFKFHKR